MLIFLRQNRALVYILELVGSFVFVAKISHL